MTDWVLFEEEEYGQYYEDGQFLGDGLSEAITASVQPPLRCRSYRLNRPLDSECLELSLTRARDVEQESRGRGNTTVNCTASATTV
ncbi:hypothetical protein NDU88_000119 [Pleurodeles waltl]|uniref:Uncharacterized protein n=1 Tax=Pleurodeles waltl TaxID=8319 RepID=A0AAV7SVQ4_PLEWA|nr:hypothetical protein NDU88_000119 [Pleurodeles waltl]